jgi:hypothetical protein
LTFGDGHGHDVDASFLDYIGDQGHDRFLSEGWILRNAYNNAVFSPALEEALIPTNLTNIGMAFALYLINKNPMTPCQQPLREYLVREDTFFHLLPPRPESPTTRKSYVTGDLLEKQRSPSPLDDELNVPAKNPGQWLSGHHALQRSRRSLRLAGDEKPTRGA